MRHLTFFSKKNLPILLLLLSPIFSASVSAQFSRLGFEQGIKTSDSLSFEGRTFDFSSEISEVYAAGGKYSLLCNEDDGNRGSLSVRRGSFKFKGLQIRRAWGTFPLRIEGYLKGNKVFGKRAKVGKKFSRVGLVFSRKIDSLVVISEKKFNPVYIDNIEIQLLKLPVNIISEPKKEPVEEIKPEKEVLAETKPEEKPAEEIKTEEKPKTEAVTEIKPEEKTEIKAEETPKNKPEEKPKTEEKTEVVTEIKTVETKPEEKPLTETEEEKPEVDDDPNHIYVLGFEGEKSGAVNLTENKHKFRVITGVSEQFPEKGKHSWAAGDRSGDFGELTVMNGSISIKSLKIRRSWGHFKAIIRAFRGDNLMAELKLEVGTDYYEHELNWEGVSRLTVVSEKKYNPLFIDQIHYIFNTPDKKLPPVSTVSRIGFEKEDREKVEALAKTKRNTVSKTQTADGKSVISSKTYSLGFENSPDAGTWVKENGHTFACRSGISSIFSASGRKSLRGKDEHGTTAQIRVQSGQMVLKAFGMRSSDAIHEVRIMGFLMGELVFDFDYRIGPEFRKYRCPSAERVDQVFFISNKKYHNVYVDRLQYNFAPGDRNDTFNEDPLNAKLPDIQADSVESEKEEDSEENEKPERKAPGLHFAAEQNDLPVREEMKKKNRH